MIIYLYGSDSYRRGKKLRELVTAYRAKHTQADVASFDFEEAPDEWQKAIDFLGQPSLFLESKLAIIRDAHAVTEKKWILTLKEYLAHPSVFLFIHDGAKPKKAFEFLLQKPVQFQEFLELEGKVLEVFVKKEAQDAGVELDAQALSFFLGYICTFGEGRSWRVVSELHRLCHVGFSQPISLTNLRMLIPFQNPLQLFGLSMNILRSRDFSQALAALETSFLQKETPAHLFNLLASQVRGADAVRFAHYDASVKVGGLEYEEALLDFVLSRK